MILFTLSTDLATAFAAIGAIAACVAIYFARQTVREQHKANAELRVERLSRRLFEIATTVQELDHLSQRVGDVFRMNQACGRVSLLLIGFDPSVPQTHELSKLHFVANDYDAWGAAHSLAQSALVELAEVDVTASH